MGFQSASPPPAPHHHTTKGPVTEVPFTSTSCPATKKKKLQKLLKDKKYNLKKEQASEPDLAGMLELSDQGLTTTMIDTRRDLTGEADSTQ